MVVSVGRPVTLYSGNRFITNRPLSNQFLSIPHSSFLISPISTGEYQDLRGRSILYLVSRIFYISCRQTNMKSSPMRDTADQGMRRSRGRPFEKSLPCDGRMIAQILPHSMSSSRSHAYPSLLPSVVLMISLERNDKNVVFLLSFGLSAITGLCI